MKLEYSIIDATHLRVKMGIKPDGAKQAKLPDGDARRKEIPVMLDVSIEDVPEGFDVKSVPKCILDHAISNIKVDAQTGLRSLGGEGSYVEKYDRMKNILEKPQTYVVSERAEKGAKSVENKKNTAFATAIRKLAGAYPKEFGKESAAIIAKFMALETAEEIVAMEINIATKWEKSNSNKSNSNK